MMLDGRPVLYFVVFSLVGIILLRLDPFGLTRLLKNYSQDLFAAAIAPCYPDGTGGPANVVPGVSTVLLTENDLTAFQANWPPPYAVHAMVLQAIRANRPRALVIDIAFEDERSDATIEALTRELQRYHEEAIPVFAASLDGKLRSGVEKYVRSAPVPKSADWLDGVTRFYRLYHTHSPGEPRQRTLAFSVLHHLYPGRDETTPEIRLHWRIPQEQPWMPCTGISLCGLFFPDSKAGFRSTCPTTPTVPARLLIEGGDYAGQIERTLAGNVVFYAAHFAGAVDVIDTPLHTGLPGVFLHATALDNLLNFSIGALRHEDHEIECLGVDLVDLAILLVVAAVVAFFKHGDGRARARRCARRSIDFAAWAISPLFRRLKPAPGRQALCARVRSGAAAIRSFAISVQSLPAVARTRAAGKRIAAPLIVLIGKQTLLLATLVVAALLFVCSLPRWVLGANVLFLIAWTELFEIIEKIGEANKTIRENSSH